MPESATIFVKIAVQIGPASCADMDARMAARMAFTEVKLGLTEAQKAEFKRLTETMKTASAPLRQGCTDAATAQPLPARLETMQKAMAARSEVMAKLAPEMIRFYQTLTPAQQKLADESLMAGPGMGGGMGSGGHHGMMGR